ncbi:hypothetical protein B0A48_01686 [Cryoendolithus antarcticus]|uniref:Uncharacterized protein n=1 Tax=Cryoendolithus antarcticus TaxID=1507870 RepID=A0A1V8TQD3_9PEZI|nr:hypothetical protein B0A48_01686 [Cryoendolithus antarcticus]
MTDTRPQPINVPRGSNATYGPVPREDHLFGIEGLAVAPTPIVVDSFLSVLLRGQIEKSGPTAGSEIQDADLASATLDITVSTAYADSQVDEPWTVTIPLLTRPWRPDAHIAIRDKDGAHVEQLTTDGSNDILADMSLLSTFTHTGVWKFQFVARLADDRCLFAISLTQYLKGGIEQPPAPRVPVS